MSPSDSPVAILSQLAFVPEHGMAAVFQAFFDESAESDDGVFCVAGYAFTTLNLRRFEKAWIAMLRRAGLPHFRMSSCAHGRGAFKDLDKDARIAVQTEAIGLINRYAAFGVAATIDQADFGAKWNAEVMKSAYECCVLGAVTGVRQWAEHNKPGVKFAFVFEAGQRYEKRAATMLSDLFSNPQGRERYGSPRWAFMPKEESPAAQAADMLAWLWMSETKRRRDDTGRAPRKDLLALVASPPHETLAIDAERWNERVYAAMRTRLAVSG